jgi:hypothetical protein
VALGADGELARILPYTASMRIVQSPPLVSPAPIPPDALIVLSGGSADGRAAFLADRFLATEIVSLDRAAASIFDVEAPSYPRAMAADWLMTQVLVRLAAGSRTVVDAGGLQPIDIEGLLRNASACGRAAALLLLVAEGPGRTRSARPPVTAPSGGPDEAADLGAELVARALAQGWAIAGTVTQHSRLDWAVCAPYPTATGWDAVGDIHGCGAALWALVEALGYVVTRDAAGTVVGATHPEGRRLAFAGDLVSRGPESVAVLRAVRQLVADGGHVLVPGNHELALAYALAHPDQGQMGDAEVAVFGACDAAELADLAQFLHDLPWYAVLRCPDVAAELVLSHAGLERRMVGRADGWLRGRCAHGRPLWDTQVYGADVRTRVLPWQADYPMNGPWACAHGHWPTWSPRGGRRPSTSPDVTRRGQCVNVDTGCVLGGALTALQWPEGTTVSVPGLDARKPGRPPARRSGRERAP